MASSASPIDLAFLHDQDDVTEIVLVRHGQQRFPGRGPESAPREFIDPPLSEIGIRQAVAVGTALADQPVHAVYSSHLQRARLTGEQIAHRHGIEPVVDEDLREFDLFAQLPQDEPLRANLDAEAMARARDRFVAERMWHTYPYAEPSGPFRERVLGAYDRILEAHRGRTVVIACHGGVINTICGHVLGHPEDMFFRPAHASIARIGVRDDRHVVRSLGETHHLHVVDPALVTF